MHKIIVVDDKKEIREGLSQMLRDHIDWAGEILLSENGREALASIYQNGVDVLVCDIKMPVMDGIELLRRLGEDGYPFQAVMLSGYDDYQYVRSALKLGAYDYLLKPVGVEMLVKSMQGVRALLEAAPRPRLERDYAGLVLDRQLPLLYEAEFFDSPAAWEASGEELEALLARAGDHICAGEYTQGLPLVERFFDGAAAAFAQPVELRESLHRWIFSLMSRDPDLIREVSTHKLTDYDITGVVKNIPTLSQMRYRFLECLREYFRELEGEARTQDEFIIRTAKHLIERSDPAGLSLNRIADALHLSPNYFSALFKSKTGSTFREYALNHRMHLAKRMLLDLGKSVAEIGFALGYEDTAHFNRAFKNSVGCTPSQYRRRGR